MNNKIKKVAIVYHYVAHYRKPIFDSLCRDGGDVEYYVLADQNPNIASLEVIKPDFSLSNKAISEKWIKLTNQWLTKDILWQKGLIQLSLSRQFDGIIFLGNMYFLSTWISAILARLSGKKVYFWTHGFRDKEKGVKGFFRSLFYHLAHGLFLYGNRAKDILISKGFDEKKLHVIYNSLDYERQCLELKKITDSDRERKKSELGFLQEDKVLIATGRITKDKRFDLLVDALAVLNKDGHRYKLVIVGEGPEKESVLKKAKIKGVESDIYFYGACYDEAELATLISLSNVSVVPGDIGLSAIHALTYGTPVVTHNNFSTHKPEFEAIRDNISGSFYEYGNMDDLAEKLRYWCGRNRGESFESCRNIIAKFYNAPYQKSIINKTIIEAV
jgi:glycosyltransferase involved in cell wall biosynthesis